ncbi:Zinc finger protein CONSTANS-LIKE 14 [Camellia lanceoleosa]|uniref:Zinc finger protein CONSTANS-LIKE 14 n=1 Tax=Camellia lanceoleosa TaxID=1840588 RepID=A0ACC0FET7_9ERIC|nr:Zinc finger protein CONSTANS-LIKE 14 [Camellia lanceoleosa]
MTRKSCSPPLRHTDACTVGSNGRPSNCTVVFRGFEENNDYLFPYILYITKIRIIICEGFEALIPVRVFREREKWLATNNLLLCNDCDWDAHYSCFVSASHDRNPVKGLSDLLSSRARSLVASASPSNIEAATVALGRFSSSFEPSLKIVSLIFKRSILGSPLRLDFRLLSATVTYRTPPSNAT